MRTILRPLLDIGNVLRRTLNEEPAPGAVGAYVENLKPYANVIIFLTQKSIELDEQCEKEWASQRATDAIDITRQCRDLLVAGSPDWKLLDERLTALVTLAAPEAGESDPPSRMRLSSS